MGQGDHEAHPSALKWHRSRDLNVFILESVFDRDEGVADAPVRLKNLAYTLVADRPFCDPCDVTLRVLLSADESFSHCSPRENMSCSSR